MPRKLRVEYAGACYHVINRGNYRRGVFAGEGAAEAFERCLFEACERFAWRLHAYVIMRNHFHLALETPQPGLSDGMKWLQGTWAARFNRYRGEVGRPFQGRFKALHVEPGHALAQVGHYIHLNPVRARVVTPEDLSEFRWGSLWWFLKPKPERPAFLDPFTVLSEAGRLVDTPEGWSSYLEYLGLMSEEEPSRRQERAGRLSRGWAIGSEDFRKMLLERMATERPADERFALLGVDRQAQVQVREALWEETLQKLAGEMKVDLSQLPARKSAPPKVLLAAAMKLSTSVSNSWLATRLAMGDPASVSQYVRRLRLSNDAEKQQVKEVLSRFKT